mgnify:CR=1 FL=1
MTSTKFITYLSPAKLNLGLRILNKREDGYHNLKTIFCLINLFDKVSIQIIDNPKISLIEHKQAWAYQNDLSYKAAKLLQQVTNTQLGANIKISKTIPSGAGLGGGSSDAATTLIMLNNLWNTKLSKQKLIELGSTLGADVPFFIYGQNAVATGIGDQFTPIIVPEEHFVLVKPNFNISTRDVFNSLNLTSTRVEEPTNEILLKSRFNDLQKIACEINPELTKIINSLKTFGNPTMTGSGSVVYLSYTDKNIAKNIAKELKKQYNSYLVSSLDCSPVFML